MQASTTDVLRGRDGAIREELAPKVTKHANGRSDSDDEGQLSSAAHAYRSHPKASLLFGRQMFCTGRRIEMRLLRS
jgi:hypothetical protein